MSVDARTLTPLAGQVALVTGGAGGLGGSICRALAAAGASVAVGYHSGAAAAADLARALDTDCGQKHAAVAACVTDSAALRDTAGAIETRWGRCDILVNCAGTTRFVPHAELDALDDTTIDAILATNVRGAFAAVRALRGLLARDGNGLVVNISSIAARTGMGSNVMYCASKAALDNLTVSLARALAPDIRVVSVAPGLVDTPFIANLDPAWRAEQARRTPLQRLAQAGEVARAVVALAVDLPFTTGAVIPVDGGRPLN